MALDRSFSFLLGLPVHVQEVRPLVDSSLEFGSFISRLIIQETSKTIKASFATLQVVKNLYACLLWCQSFYTSLLKARTSFEYQVQVGSSTRDCRFKAFLLKIFLHTAPSLFFDNICVSLAGTRPFWLFVLESV